MSSHNSVIGPLVLEKKIFEVFLPYMGVAAILVMWSRPREQTFVPLSHWGSIWNLALISQSVLEKKIFENGGGRTDGRTTTDGRRTDGRTTDHGYTISSPMSLKAQVNLKTLNFYILCWRSCYILHFALIINAKWSFASRLVWVDAHSRCTV